VDLLGLIPSFGNLALTLVAFVAALSIIVFVHEYGHYIVGRWSGIHAEVFSLGFGPVLYARTDRRGTRWQVAALPFGGYVKFLGDADAASAGKDESFLEHIAHAEREKEIRRSMHGAPLWARASTVAAGPVFNFILSILIYACFLLFMGPAVPQPTVGQMADLPAPSQPVDLRPGDVVVGLGGRPVESFDGLQDAAAALDPAPVVPYTVRRDGAEIEVPGPWPYPALVEGFQPLSAGKDAGLRIGDVILEAGGREIVDFTQLVEVVTTSGGNPIPMVVWRDGSTFDLSVTPRSRDYQPPGGEFERRWMLGIPQSLAFEPARESAGLVGAITGGAAQTWGIVTTSLSALGKMVTGVISACNVSGPITIARASGDMASQGLTQFIQFVALLSTAVGMLNLFPIPVLDGGHLMFHAYEAVFRRPPSEAALKRLMAVGLTLILALMFFALFNDFRCR
jgi:regulator of sigma E protease